MSESKLRCSFCGKNRDEVKKLIAGPNVYICNECVQVSYDILDTDNSSLFSATVKHHIPTPTEIKDFLDEYIVGHNEAKVMLSISAYNHYKRIFFDFDVDIEKSNILLVGPTGTGKTLFAKTLSKKLDVPLIIADATTLTEAGYVGDDVDLLLEKLLVAAEYDIQKAQTGIIYIDEIDKKARRDSSQTGRDVSGEGVQQSLLRLLEGSEVKVRLNKSRQKYEEYVFFDTTNILFILGGSFAGIEREVERRLSKTEIGFTANILQKQDREKLIQAITAEDIINYGIIPELIGRVPIIGILDKLDKKQLRFILSDVKNNIISQYKALLSKDNIEIEFSDQFLDTVAEHALSRNLGARALRSILEEVLISIMFAAPDLHNQGVEKIILGKYPEGSEKPVLVFKNGHTESFKQYTLYRGNNEISAEQ